MLCWAKARAVLGQAQKLRTVLLGIGTKLLPVKGVTSKEGKVRKQKSKKHKWEPRARTRTKN